MSSAWYYQEDGVELGPITFHELVALVKDGRLGRDDFVRPGYQKQWQRAEDTVCLFEMAERIPRERLRLAPVVEHAGAAAVDSVLEDGRFTEGNDDRALQKWFQEQLAATCVNGTVGEVPDDESGLISSSKGFGVETSRTVPKSLWQSVVAAAVARFDMRHGDHDAVRCRWWWHFGRFVPRVESLNVAMRLGFRCVVAAGVGWLTWSLMQQADATEALRFPGWQQRSGVKVVPIIGECSPAEFAFFVWDFVVVMAIAGYAGARWVERHAQDV